MFVRIVPNKFLVIVASLLIVAVGCNKKSNFITIDSTALGTFVQVKCKTTLPPEEIHSIIEEIDREAKASMSIFDPNSLLSAINRNEQDGADKHIIYNIALAKKLSQISNGAYDITIKPLTDAWGFGREKGERREPNIDSLLAFIGHDKLNIEGKRVIKQDPRIQIDLNSIAKGYVVDMVAERLESLGIVDYMINIGGELRCKGKNPRDAKWTIGIETPYDGNMAMDSFEKIISIDNVAVATSGNYRRFYINEEGQKIVHTIDPRTGYSVVSTLLSATVVAKECALADAAATMFMALGSDEALEVAKRYEATFDWKYYFIFADGEGYRVECSEEFRE